MEALLRTAICLGYLLLVLSCTTANDRPNNVPTEAVKVIGAKGTGPWQICSFTANSNDSVRCQIYNTKGETLYDDVFVVYSGKEPKSATDLKVSSKGGDQWVKLENGTVLIPKSQKEEMTKALDWLFGKREKRTP